MDYKDYINYTIKKVSMLFSDVTVIRSDFENVMGFILVFEKDNIQISFVVDRGFLEGEIISASLKNDIFKKHLKMVISNKGKHYLLFHSINPSLINLELSIENVDLIIDFLYKNRNEIFVDE